MGKQGNTGLLFERVFNWAGVKSELGTAELRRQGLRLSARASPFVTAESESLVGFFY